ncbi:MAG: hypothetical protein JST58_20200 [Bacteroidetes bacterium]|nr:hypothetical protein [Bacteroidota bacterium]
MKKIFAAFLILLFIVGCKSKKNAPDVSKIDVTVKIERFDKAFFSLDTNHIQQGLFKINQQFPYFANDFMINILGAEPLSDTSNISFMAARQFLSSYWPAKDSIEKKFDDMGWLEKELQQSFRYVKYYFPKYQLPPKVVTYIGPFDAPGVAITQYTLAIGLQLYMGKNFSFYTSMQGQEMYPSYISRRFEPAYITTNCMKAISEDLFVDKSGSKALIEQMIDKGKYWWLVGQFMPDADDSLITGYTGKQMEWCKKNEGLIWNFFLQSNNELYSVDPDVIKNYIGDAPNTPGMPDIAPGNIGQWVGLQIVKSYAEKNPSITPVELMKMDARKIFEETKYKPR